MSNRDQRSKPFTFGADHQAAPRGHITMPGWLKLLLVVVVVLGSGAGYLYLVDPELGRELLGDTPIAPPPRVTTAYKWRDEHGNWQLTDQPPPEGTPYQKLEAHSDANIMPSLKSAQD